MCVYAYMYILVLSVFCPIWWLGWFAGYTSARFYKMWKGEVRVQQLSNTSTLSQWVQIWYTKQLSDSLLSRPKDWKKTTLLTAFLSPGHTFAVNIYLYMTSKTLDELVLLSLAFSHKGILERCSAFSSFWICSYGAKRLEKSSAGKILKMWQFAFDADEMNPPRFP